MKNIILSLLFLCPVCLFAQGFFQKPEMTYIQAAGEKIIDINFSRKTKIEVVQDSINIARGKYPNDIIRVTLTGKFSVTNTALIIGDKTLLFLKDAVIEAAANSTATSLVFIENSEFVSISVIGKGGLDGKNKAIQGISISNSSKTHIDNLRIENCKNGGIAYLGKGMDVFADAGSVSRCIINACGVMGIQIVQSFNFSCTDNQVRSCDTGIKLSANNAVIAKNTINNCRTGISVSSNFDVISYNQLYECDTAVSMSSTSKEIAVMYNSIQKNTLGVNMNGISARVYYNECANKTELAGKGTKNQIFSNRGISAADAEIMDCFYFNPPIIGNQHKDLIKTGKGRFDLDVNGGAFGDIRKEADKAHLDRPEAVIVIHLNGAFNASGVADSLIVKEDECYILNGTISGAGSAQNLFYFSGKITASLSGGLIDGEHTNGKNGIVYVTSSANVIIDSVKIINSAAEGITKRNSTSPTYIRACTIDSCRRRGIWQLASSRLFAFENSVSRCLMDGIDLDAYTNFSVLIKNNSHDNKRYGVFIEEGANNHLVLANSLSTNASGVHFFNKEVENKFTSKNMAAFNLCQFNNRGISISSGGETKCSMDNMIFNNRCFNNKDVGIGGFYNSKVARNNYVALNSIKDNDKGPFYTKPDFVSNFIWNTLK